MKIGVVGCGAVGSYYGAALTRAGADVHFLLRSDYEAVRSQGVRIESVRGDFVAHPRAARKPEEIGVCEVVVIALKTTANDQLDVLLPALTGSDTMLVTLQNGLGNEEQLARQFDPANVFGGLCFVCLNRVAPGVIRHTAHGLVVFGEFQRRPTDRVRRLENQFREAGIPTRVAEDLDRAHWEKLVWNVPFNGLGVAGIVGRERFASGNVPSILPRRATLPTDELLGDPAWERCVRELMHEIIAVARALGHPLATELAAENIERTRCMGAYKASTLLDFERGLPLEVESLFLEPQRRARSRGVPTPQLDRLCRVLQALERQGAGGCPRVLG